MSEENVEIVRSAIEAFNGRDLQVLVQALDDDFEFISVLTGVDGGAATYRGPQAWTDYFARMDETWAAWWVEDVELSDAGGNRLAAVFRIVGKGKVSGVPVERAVGITYELRRGKLWRMRSYAEPGDALRAVGLSE